METEGGAELEVDVCGAIWWWPPDIRCEPVGYITPGRRFNPQYVRFCFSTSHDVPEFDHVDATFSC